MADPYYRYNAPTARDGVARPSFPGYFSSEAPTLFASSGSGTASDFPPTDINPIQSGVYGVNDVSSLGAHPEPSLPGLSAGASIGGYTSPLDDSYLQRQRPDYGVGIDPGPPEMVNERPASLKNVENFSAPAPTSALSRESNILFVDGLPTDCTRREVGHIFRPFIGFKDIRVIHKEARRTGDKAMVFCFVEFADSKYALTAMEALQGYKFDDKKPDSPCLRIHFAHFPFSLPSDRDRDRVGAPPLTRAIQEVVIL